MQQAIARMLGERGGPPSIVSLIEDLRARIADPEARALADAVQPA